jgi:phosphatidylglycerophosphate synthase
VISGPGFGKYADAVSDEAMFALASLVALAGLVTWAILEHAHVGRALGVDGSVGIETRHDQA